MRIFIKAIFIIGLYQIAILIQSCCDGNQYEFYYVNDFNIVNIHKHDLTIQSDSTTIDYQDFSINLDFLTEKYAQLINSSRFGNEVYAFDCDDELLYKIKNKITKIEIVSNQDFDDSHPTGSLLNDYFIPYRLIKTCIENGGDFESCAENQFEFFNTLEEAFNRSFTQSSHIDLSNSYNEINILDLIKKPDFNGFLKFIIELEFEDGMILIDSTKVIKIE